MAWLEDPVRVTRRLLKLRRLLDDPPLLDDGKTRRGASAPEISRGPAWTDDELRQLAQSVLEKHSELLTGAKPLAPGSPENLALYASLALQLPGRDIRAVREPVRAPGRPGALAARPEPIAPLLPSGAGRDGNAALITIHRTTFDGPRGGRGDPRRQRRKAARVGRDRGGEAARLLEAVVRSAAAEATPPGKTVRGSGPRKQRATRRERVADATHTAGAPERAGASHARKTSHTHTQHTHTHTHTHTHLRCNRVFTPPIPSQNLLPSAARSRSRVHENAALLRRLRMNLRTLLVWMDSEGGGDAQRLPPLRPCCDRRALAALQSPQP